MKKVKKLFKEYGVLAIIFIVCVSAIIYSIKIGSFSTEKNVTVIQTYLPAGEQLNGYWIVEGRKFEYTNELWKIKIKNKKGYKVKIYYDRFEVLESCKQNKYKITSFQSDEYFLDYGGIYEKIVIKTEDKSMWSDDKRLQIIHIMPAQVYTDTLYLTDSIYTPNWYRLEINSNTN